MNYRSSPMCYCLLVVVCLHLATGRIVPSRDDGKLDHRIGDLFHRLSTTTSVPTDNNNNNKRPLSSVMKSDIQAAILILRQSQLQIQTVLSSQKKMLDKLHHWQSKVNRFNFIEIITSCLINTFKCLYSWTRMSWRLLRLANRPTRSRINWRLCYKRCQLVSPARSNRPKWI